MNRSLPLQPIFATAALLLASLTLRAASVDELLKNGDAFDQRFEAAEALKFYLPAEEQEPKNPRILVRIARQYRHLMTDATATEEKLKLGAIGLSYAKRAAALAPDDSEAQLSVAISYGKMLPILSKKEQVDASRRVKDAADKALQLDPRNDLAWHTLGRWHRVLADISPLKRALAPLFYGKLPTGTNEDAIKCFAKAIEINPNRLMHYIELGRVYAQMGRKADARRFIEKGLAMPNTEKDDPELKARGRETLEKIR